MKVESCIQVVTEEDIVQARQAGRLLAQQLGFDEAVQAQLVTAISELAENMYAYAQQGMIFLSPLKQDGKEGIKIIARDSGPGIPDIQKILDEPYQFSQNSGSGLLGVKRIVDEFLIKTDEGEGTEITVTKWLQKQEAREDAR